MQQRLQDEQFSLLQCAVVEAEGIVLDAVAKVDDPLHVRCISTPGLSFLILLLIPLNILISSFTLHISLLADYLINRAELTLASIDKMQQSHAAYLRNYDGKVALISKLQVQPLVVNYRNIAICISQRLATSE